MMRVIRLIFVVIFLVVVASPVSAQIYCGPREQILASLAKQYHEQPTAIGLASGGTIIELLSSTSGSWTLLSTRANGITCVLLVGEAWENIPLQLSGNDT